MSRILLAVHANIYCTNVNSAMGFGVLAISEMVTRMLTVFKFSRVLLLMGATLKVT